MEQIKSEGLAKSIGVSNYTIEALETTIKNATSPPTVNQVEFNAYLQQPKLLEFHKKHNIATEAYGPLTPITKASPGPVDEFLAALAKKYAVHEAEILLRWCVDQDVIPITTTQKTQRLSDYLRCMTFKLTPKEIETISQQGTGKHFRGFWTGDGKFSKDE